MKRYKTIKCKDFTPTTPRYSKNSYYCKCRDSGCGAVIADYPNLKYNGLLIRDEYEFNSFLLFPTYEDFIAHSESLPIEKRCFHEIIPGARPQKAKIDIDFPGDNTQLAESIKDDINIIMRRVFYLMYYDQLVKIISSTNNITESTGEYFSILNSIKIVETCSKGATETGEFKIGYHLIIKDFFMPNNKDAKLFTNFVIDMVRSIHGINTLHLDSIDRDTCKDIQGLRLIGCHKPGQLERIKKRINIDAKNSDTLITLNAKYKLQSCDLHADLSPIVKKYKGGQKTLMNEETIKKMCFEKMTVEEKEIFIFRDIDKDIFVNFTRTAASHCTICDRQHDSENTLYFCIFKGDVYKKCRRAPRSLKGASKAFLGN